MPGIIGAVTGFIERQKGRGYVESSALQRMGKAAAATCSLALRRPVSAMVRT